jgi:subfamily B ATP-binding cassette protein MsbA
MEEGGERSVVAELARLAPYARQHAGLFLTTIAVSVVLAVADVPVPFFLRTVLDSVLKHKEPVPLFGVPLSPGRFLLTIFAVLVGIAVGKGFLLYAQRMASETMGQRMVYQLRMDLYRHLQSLSLPYFRSASTGRIMLRFLGDINAVLDMITDGFLRALMDVITIAAVTVAILWLDWKLALVVLSVLPVYALAFVRLSPALRRSGRMVRRERSALSGNLQEKIAGAAIVKAFHREAAEESLVEAQTGRLRDWLIAKARVGGRLNAVAHATIAIGGALVLWIGGGAVLDGRMTKGSLMAFYALAAMLFPPLRRLARTNETWQAARVSLDRILDFLEETEPMKERDGSSDLRVRTGAIRFEAIRFSYVPGTPVLDGIDLDVAPGTIVALVGPNGAGKTTLVSLLPRFLSPDEGRILVDGQDIAGTTLGSLRRQIGIVPQEPFLFSGTIEENIRYGRPEATESELRQAVEAANALQFIETLPNGFLTQVGERGRRLSGGQVQRIAIARALLADPPILILDEATSAVDAESEALIQQATGRLMLGRTVFVIAHRVSTVRRADRILVMEEGRIVEEGVHEALFLKRGFYTRICQEQLLAGGVAL